MKMVKSLLLGILPEETQMKPIKGIFRGDGGTEIISPGGGTGGIEGSSLIITKESGG